MESAKELIRFLSGGIVDRPDCVQVKERDSVLELSVHKDDLGKVIGKQGRTVKAFRAVLGLAAHKAQKRYTLEIMDA